VFGKYSVRACIGRKNIEGMIVTTTLQAHETHTTAQLSHDISPLSLRSAFGQFPSGVAALAASTEQGFAGMAASSFTVGVSLDPPLVSVAIQNNSETWPILRDADSIGISILGQGQGPIARQLAAKGIDRFEGLDLETHHASIFLNHAALWLDTTVYAEYPAGDHIMVLLQVNNLADFTNIHEPLVFHKSQFRNLEID